MSVSTFDVQKVGHLGYVVIFTLQLIKPLNSNINHYALREMFSSLQQSRG